MGEDKLEFVSGLIVNEKGNVLILKRRKDLRLDPGKYDLCSGHIKEGEIPIQSMLRELKEETGIGFEKIRRIVELGEIQTPHPKLKETKSHMFYIKIDLPESKINEMMQNIKEPEMENARYIDSINTVRLAIKYTNLMRNEYTKETEEILIKAEQIYQGKEINTCEER